MSKNYESESDEKYFENNNCIQIKPIITVNPVINASTPNTVGGLVKEFQAITSLTPTQNVAAGNSVPLGILTLSISNNGNRVWLTAMIEVINNLTNTVIVYSIERLPPNSGVVCSITDVSSFTVSRNLTCVDPNPPIGGIQYILRATVEDGNATFTGNGTFTAAEIEINP